MDRLQICSAVPAELAERLSDCLPDQTEADEKEAVASIIDDYLTCGLPYPRRGFPFVTAGMFLAEKLDEDEIRDALTGLVFGHAADDERLKLSKLCDEGLAKWLRAKHQDLVERRIGELAERR